MKKGAAKKNGPRFGCDQLRILPRSMSKIDMVFPGRN